MRPAKTTPLAATVALAGIMLVAACAPQRPVPWRQTPPAPEAVTPLSEGPKGPPKAALLLPLSGPSEAIGQDLMDAAQMALFDAGENQLELLPFDTGSEPEGAMVAARAAVASGADVIIGPLFARSTTAITPIAAQANVEVLSLSNDSSVARPGVWVLGLQPEEQVERVVRFAAQNGVSRAGALAPADAYGEKAVQAFRQAATTSGLEPAGIATYPPADSTPSDAVGRVARALGVVPSDGQRPATPPPPGGAVLLADGGARLRAVASLLAYHDVDPMQIRHLATMRLADDPSALRDPQLQGAWLAGPAPEASEQFANRFSQVYGRSPSPLALLAYDTTAMVAGLSRLGPLEPTHYTDSQGFLGRAGIFRLLPDGRTERGLAVMEVNQGTLRPVDPAPTLFDRGMATLGGSSY
ncbi:MAG TPA: penicillin-binding protein activator [Geminicoccus sp.]|uniref:penicillin-binding protein activator n=1 Tax=Geminicoccus sp. TaxID=2024832 RepID=UPI002CBB8098|nr:penicillin-binding protein activator [Geminicoccus sp.]HWL71386.1 penicillin-binding protein activator [Geminicoccus sp.]